MAWDLCPLAHPPPCPEPSLPWGQQRTLEISPGQQTVRPGALRRLCPPPPLALLAPASPEDGEGRGVPAAALRALQARLPSPRGAPLLAARRPPPPRRGARNLPLRVPSPPPKSCTNPCTWNSPSHGTDVRAVSCALSLLNGAVQGRRVTVGGRRPTRERESWGPAPPPSGGQTG